MRLAIVGIRGLPNNYGGFETLADHLVQYLSKDLKITVYCSSKDMPEKLDQYNGAKLKYIPVTSHGAFGMLYDSISLINAVFSHDKVLFLGFGGGFVMPLLRAFRSKIILNIGGLDWKRNKWSPFAQKVIKKAEALLVRNSGQIISDNVGIQRYLRSEYNRDSELIHYGGDQARKLKVTPLALLTYPFLIDDYAITVTRIQSDNNIEMLLEAFTAQSKIPLVVVGNWNNSPYGIALKKKYLNKNNLILLDAIYQNQELDILRSNCKVYVHGNSAGGTNPALVEAMYLQLPVFAFASGYNEHTTENKALYFTNIEQLKSLIANYENLELSQIGQDLQEIAQRLYTWRHVTEKYMTLFTEKRLSYSAVTC